jgi:hypothetical protein
MIQLSRRPLKKGKGVELGAKEGRTVKSFKEMDMPLN